MTRNNAGRTKYNARTVTKNGEQYDSVKEMHRHECLLLEQRAGAVRNLRRQVKYEIIPKLPGERATHYIADFVYERKDENGVWQNVVEDVKGYRDGSAYRLFVVKRKLMLKEHGIVIQEV